ncbi:MAG: hypothetical protein MUP24_05100, partial [Gillisia sp.]|nr:hypothetical protein [Gillisia sp.]
MENFTNKSIEIASLPQFEEVAFQPISKSYLLKSNLQNLAFLCMTMIGWAVLIYFDIINQTQLIILLIGIDLYFGFKFWNIFRLQKNYGFALREKDI